MILKIIGAVIIVLSSTLIGFFYSRKEEYRINDLNEMKRAFTILISEIEYASNSLPESMINISNKTENPISKILIDFAENLNKKDGQTIQQLWTEAVIRNKNDTYFIDEDLENIKSFGSTLGYLDRNMQINNINMMIDYINKKTDTLSEISIKNKKMYRSLGILGGMIIAIILI